MGKNRGGVWEGLGGGEGMAVGDELGDDYGETLGKDTFSGFSTFCAKMETQARPEHMARGTEIAFCKFTLVSPSKCVAAPTY